LSEQKRRELYPEIEPRKTGHLPVSHGHEIYWEECGAPDGLPVIVIHGGPGGGVTPALRRYFDPERWRIFLFDQRGCGKSRPFSRLEENTTWRLIEDMEAIREMAGVESWTLFGGSWGSTLALAYAVTHPDRTDAMALRGIFLHTQDELNWLYRDGANRFYPDAWERLMAPLTDAEQETPVAAYHERLMADDKAVRMEAAMAWTRWEGDLLSIGGPEVRPEDFDSSEFADAFARIETHYFTNGGFFPEDGWLLTQLPKLDGIPLHIINGRYDVLTPPHMATRLHKAVRGSTIEYIQDAGHASSEPGIIDALVRATDELAGRLSR